MSTIFGCMRGLALAFCLVSAAAATGTSVDSSPSIKEQIDPAVRSIMTKYQIPGMAVGVIVEGKPYVFDYGVASTEPNRPVTQDTLFEIGSISKTFTATLASYMQTGGHLSLADQVGKYLPSLRGSKFGDLSLLHLATHTPGGLPLQVPAEVKDNAQLLDFLQAWQPAYAPGTHRSYSNISIGTLGLIVAKSANQPFATLMQQRLFLPLGLSSTYIHIPPARMARYAQGHTEAGKPIRMAPGVLSAEAYGIRTTASDLLRFLQANMGLIALDDSLQRAITQTHTGYFQAGGMTQDLIWEQFPYPVGLQTVLEGNSSAMIFTATPVTAMVPPQRPRADAWINKTGSTNGFSAYVAFIPQKRLGIVLLANKSFPIRERVTTAYRILASLDHDQR